MARNLVEGECGSENALMKLTSHFTNDKAFQQVVHTPVSFQHSEGSTMAPETFHMGCLLQEMTDIEEASIAKKHQELTLSQLSTDGCWVDDFLMAAEQQNRHNEFNQLSESNCGWVQDYFCGDELVRLDNHDEHVEPVRHLPSSVDHDGVWSETEFIEFVKRTDCEESTAESGQLVEESVVNISEDNWVSSFMSAEGDQLSPENWVEEFVSLADNTSNVDTWKAMEDQWENVDSNSNGHPWLTEFEQSHFDQSYRFEEDSPVRDHPQAFTEGLRCLDSGDIASAVLYFEAAVQQDTEHAEAWKYLGTSQAFNEQDSLAIAALKRCLELSPGDLMAWQSLAVSLINESMESEACSALKSWLKHNHQYSHLVHQELAPEPVVSSFMTSAEYEETKELYLRTVQSALSRNSVDPDVQCNLGLLFHLSAEYDKAVDCFQAALQITTKDALLWNRLGATLANGQRSEEAVDAYRNALQLSPGFVRCRYNLGIACVNLGVHREAVEHFVTALSMQRAGRGPSGSQCKMSTNIWTTLRMTLLQLGRSDLYPACDSGDLDTLKSEFGMVP